MIENQQTNDQPAPLSRYLPFSSVSDAASKLLQGRLSKHPQSEDTFAVLTQITQHSTSRAFDSGTRESSPDFSSICNQDGSGEQASLNLDFVNSEIRDHRSELKSHLRLRNFKPRSGAPSAWIDGPKAGFTLEAPSQGLRHCLGLALKATRCTICDYLPIA